MPNDSVLLQQYAANRDAEAFAELVKLKKTGVGVSVAVLAGMLTANGAYATPAALVASLGKMAIAGVGKGAVGVAAGGFFGTVGGEIAAVAIAVGIVIGGVALRRNMMEPEPESLPAVASTTNSTSTATITTTPPAEAPKEEKPVTEKTFRYGFRYDPMTWALSADGLDAAWVRTIVLGQPKPGDAAIIDDEIERILSQQKPDGSIGDETHSSLMRLLDLGCPTEMPEFQRALKAMCDRQIEKEGRLKGYELTIACRSGWENADQLKKGVIAWSEEVAKINFWHACPWSGEVHLQTLWAGREHADVAVTLENGLTTMRDHLKDGRHWPLYLDPFGWLECMGYIDHPVAKEIVLKMLPMIIRAQSQDGSWGGEGHLGYGSGSRTFATFRALHKWGLLEPLRQAPALPDEWRILKTIPAPEGDLQTMTCDGKRLWVYDKGSDQAIAVSMQDGAKLASIRLPEKVGGICWSDGALLVTRPQPETVLLIDPESGAVREEITAKTWGEFTAIADAGGCIRIGNLMCGGAHTLKDGKISKGAGWLAGGFAVDMADGNGSVWHIDAFNRLMIKSDAKHTMRLRDWTAAPFGEYTVGIASDGKNLWALDSKNGRICMIERLDMRQLLLDRLSTLVDEEGKPFRESLEASQEGVAGALARIAPELDLVQKLEGGEIRWYDDEDRLQAMFFVIPDPRDLDAVLNSYARTRDLGCPFTVNFVRQWSDAEGDWDIFVNHGGCRIRHCNRFWGPNRKRVKREPELRQDIYTLFSCDTGFPAPGNKGWFDLLSGPIQGVIDRLDELARERDCVQTIENDIPVWRDADGNLQVMFEILPDHTDLDSAIRMYERIRETKCPITFQITKEWPDVFDFMRFSGRSYIEHHNQAKRNGER